MGGFGSSDGYVFARRFQTCAILPTWRNVSEPRQLGCERPLTPRLYLEAWTESSRFVSFLHGITGLRFREVGILPTTELETRDLIVHCRQKIVSRSRILELELSFEIWGIVCIDLVHRISSRKGPLNRGRYCSFQFSLLLHAKRLDMLIG